MKKTVATLTAVALLLAANLASSQVAHRVPRQQDKNFRWDSQLGAWVREVPRQVGLDAHHGMGDASPVDIRNNASAPQFSRSLTTDQTNSRVDDYINQDEQINVTPDSGVVKVLRVNQKRLVNDYVTALVPMANVPPRELRGVFRNVCGKEGGWADCVYDYETGKHSLQVVCPKFQLPYVVAALKQLDQNWVKENEDGRAQMYYPVKFRNAGPLLNLLQFFRGPIETFCWDDVGNAIQFTGQPAIILGLLPWALEMCDIPPSQIKLDVAMYEVNVKNDLKLGLDWVAWKNGPGRDLFEGIVAGGQSYIGHFRWANLHAMVTTAYLDFLASKGKARLVSRSSLTARSGRLAELSAVDEVLAFNVTHNPDAPVWQNIPFTTPPLQTYLPSPPGPSLQPIGPPGPLVPDATVQAVLDREDALIPLYHERVLNYVRSGTVGVFLAVQPFVGIQSTEMAITLHATDLDGYTPQGQPIINHRFVNSQVRVYDGKPFVVAGLKRKESVKSKNGIPWLSSLPVLGWLTGQETNSEREVELVVVITPTFDVSTESKVEVVESKILMSEDENAAKQFALGQKQIPLPKNSFGFDQWLLNDLDM